MTCVTPQGFRDDVRRRVQFEDAGSDLYRVLQFIEEISRKKWVAIDEYQRGARSSERGCCCCFLTLTDPLRIQPWSQDRRNQTKSTGNRR